jgi:hypothetical protein
MHGVKLAFMPYEYKKTFIQQTKKQVKNMLLEQAALQQ